ncbi:hypothetical protein EDC96DRAFT_258861 [Choanephora cucurbitarum]|nr:hypothetical protein EDC96DRAFT_258861 [Choanephora cucurbitarum]
MPRTLWISGAPIYLSLKLHNLNLSHKVIDTKLQLVCRYEVQNKSEDSTLDSLVCSTVFSEDVLSQVNLANSNWWKPIEPNSKDDFTMSLDVPSNLFSVQNQKLINISFFVRVSIYSQNSSDIVAELPITIAHPISLDPPPGTYAKSIKANTDDCRPFIFQDDFKKQQKAIQIIESDHSAYVIEEEFSSDIPSNCSSLTNPEDAESLDHLKLIQIDNRFSSLKKNFNSWGSRMSRKLSVASRIGTPRPSINTALKISSPLISDVSSVSSSHHEDESIDICSLSPPSILDNNQQQQSRQLQEKDKSIMKFGQMRGPKCFGHQPDCLGDAGLDIRTCFNVPTATEALQSYAAEKVEIAMIPMCPEPVILSDNLVWREGLIAPPEKCEIHASMLASEDCHSTEEDEQLDDFKEETRVRKYPSQTENQTNKRMLASSRHLRNVQRKSTQISRDGRSLLTLPDCTA